MRIKKGFVLRPLADEYIIMEVGPAQVDFNKMISLNSTAAYLWKAVEGKDFTEKDLVDLILAEYSGVDEQTATKDAAALARKWVEIGLVEE